MAMAKDLKHRMHDYTEAGKERAMRAVEDRIEPAKRTAGDRASIYSRAVRAAADSLRSSNEYRIADYAESLANRVEVMGDSIRDRGILEIYGQLMSYGKRRPLFVMIGSLVAGFFASRFGKMEARRSSQKPDIPKSEDMRSTILPEATGSPVVSDIRPERKVS